MLYLTCTMIFSVDLAYFGVIHAKDWVSVDCGTTVIIAKKNAERYKQSCINQQRGVYLQGI